METNENSVCESNNKCEAVTCDNVDKKVDIDEVNKTCDNSVKSTYSSDIISVNVSKVCVNESVSIGNSNKNGNSSDVLLAQSNEDVNCDMESDNLKDETVKSVNKVDDELSRVNNKGDKILSCIESTKELKKSVTVDLEEKMEMCNDDEGKHASTTTMTDPVDNGKVDIKTSKDKDESHCKIKTIDNPGKAEIRECKHTDQLERLAEEIKTNENGSNTKCDKDDTNKSVQVDIVISENTVDCSTNIKKELTKSNDETSVGAFTKCQDSGTEDSDSDSDESESESESSSVESEKIIEESESSDEEPVQVKPSANGGKNQNQREKKKKGGARYKHELDLEDLPPIEDLHITVLEDECEPLGTVYSIVNQLVVIQALPNTPALNLDSLIFKKDGHCLGQIFDVFGPVKTPFYTLRFNSHEDINEKGIEKGQTVYCAPQTPHTKYVFTYQLMQQKGSDASWRHNYEVPEAYQDYSDDEQERRAHRKGQQKARGRPSGLSNDSTPQKHVRVKKEFNHSYDRVTGNEWYKTRANEMNQFNNRSNQSSHFNRFPNMQQSPNQNSQYPSHQNSFYGNNSYEQNASSPSGMNSFTTMPPPVLRPPTPISWHRPQPNSPGPFNGPPPMPFSSPPPQFNQPYQMTPPYEKLTPPNFSNAMSPRGPPPQNWQPNPNYGPFGFNNSRNTSHPSAVPPLSGPNMTNIRPIPPGMPPNLFSQPPPGPPPPKY